LFFLLYINDLPAIIRDLSNPTLFADDISWILVSSDPIQLKNNLVIVFGKIIDWFQANSFSLNLIKTYYMHFKAKMSQLDQSTLKYMDNQINLCIDFFRYDSIRHYPGKGTYLKWLLS
jgi:hypothetical protein